MTFVRPMVANRSEITDFIIEVMNTTEYRYLDLGIESEDSSLTYLENIVLKPTAQDREIFRTEHRENLTEVVRALPAVTHAERGEPMTLACSILVPVSTPQYAVVDWTVFTPGSGGNIPKPKSVFFYKNIGGDVQTFTFGDQAYKGEAKAEPFSKKGGRSGSIVSSYLSVAAFNPVDHSGEYSCHLHVDGVTVKLSSVVVPHQVNSLFAPRDVRVKTELCDGTEHFYEQFVGCIRCTALGHPIPTVSVIKNDTELVALNAGIHWGRPRHSVITYHMIENVLPGDEGVYECLAQQDATEVTMRHDVNVTMFEAT